MMMKTYYVDGVDLNHVLGKCQITKNDITWIKYDSYFTCEIEDKSKEMAKQLKTLEQNMKTFDNPQKKITKKNHTQYEKANKLKKLKKNPQNLKSVKIVKLHTSNHENTNYNRSLTTNCKKVSLIAKHSLVMLMSIVWVTSCICFPIM